MEELLPCPGCGKHNGVLQDRGYGLNESTFEYWVECAKCLTIRSPMCKTPEAAIDWWNENAENAARTDRIRTFAKKYDDLITERDRLRQALIDIQQQAGISFFSDCSRGVEKCFAMQHIREIIDKALTEDKKNECE